MHFQDALNKEVTNPDTLIHRTGDLARYCYTLPFKVASNAQQYVRTYVSMYVHYSMVKQVRLSACVCQPTAGAHLVS